MLSGPTCLKLKHPNLADTADFNLSASIPNLKVGRGTLVLFICQKEMSVNHTGR